METAGAHLEEEVVRDVVVRAHAHAGRAQPQHRVQVAAIAEGGVVGDGGGVLSAAVE